MSKARRILHVIATLDRAGTEMVCLGSVKGMRSRGVTNRVVALRVNSGLISEDLAPIAGEPRILPDNRLGRILEFGRSIDQFQPDGIVFHFFTLDHVLMAAVARLRGVSRIVVSQGNPAASGKHLRKKLRLILWASRALGLRLVSVSNYIQSTMAELGKLPKGSSVVWNGCDVADIAGRASKTRQDRSPAEVRVLMIARLDSIKDHATLIRALAHIPEVVGGRKVILDLVGEGPKRSELQLLAASEGVVERVRFLGAKSDIPERLGGADIFCLSTTDDEGFGVVLIEALAAGVPVIASDVPACREVLANGKFGRLVEAGNVEALKAAICDAIVMPPKVPTLDQVRNRYGLEAMAEGYLRTLFSETGRREDSGS